MSTHHALRRIHELEAQVGDLLKKVTALQASETALKGRVTGLQTQLTAASQTIATLQAQAVQPDPDEAPAMAILDSVTADMDATLPALATPAPAAPSA